LGIETRDSGLARTERRRRARRESRGGHGVRPPAKQPKLRRKSVVGMAADQDDGRVYGKVCPLAPFTTLTSAEVIVPLIRTSSRKFALVTAIPT
jgi:hypothetical protein